MNRDEKASLVAELSGKLAQAKIAIVTDYRGLTVPVFESLRTALKENNAEIQVSKNTLLRRAAQGTEFAILGELLKGTTAVTVSYGDVVAPAKVITDFAKANPKLVIKGGAMDGKALDVEQLLALAKLPSKEILLSQLLSVMQAVPTGLVRVLSGVPRKFLYLLQAVSDQKDAANN